MWPLNKSKVKISEKLTACENPSGKRANTKMTACENPTTFVSELSAGYNSTSSKYRE